MSAQVEELNDSNFDASVNGKDIAVIDVFASWCGSCRLFAPVFEQSAQRHADLSFYKIDGEKNPLFAGKVEIDNLPFVAVFHKGQYVGGRATSKPEALEEMIQVIRDRVGAGT